MDIGEFCKQCDFNGDEGKCTLINQEEFVGRGYCDGASVSGYPSAIFTNAGIEIDGTTYARTNMDKIGEAIAWEMSAELLNSKEVY